AGERHCLICSSAFGRIAGTAVPGVSEDAQWRQPPFSGVDGKCTSFSGRHTGPARTAVDLDDDAERTRKLADRLGEMVDPCNALGSHTQPRLLHQSLQPVSLRAHGP